jgi:hypothetical protein
LDGIATRAGLLILDANDLSNYCQNFNIFLLDAKLSNKLEKAVCFNCSRVQVKNENIIYLNLKKSFWRYDQIASALFTQSIFGELFESKSCHKKPKKIEKKWKERKTDTCVSVYLAEPLIKSPRAMSAVLKPD